MCAFNRGCRPAIEHHKGGPGRDASVSIGREWRATPFDRPFDRLIVPSNVEGLTASSSLSLRAEGLSTVEGLRRGRKSGATRSLRSGQASRGPPSAVPSVPMKGPDKVECPLFRSRGIMDWPDRGPTGSRVPWGGRSASKAGSHRKWPWPPLFGQRRERSRQRRGSTARPCHSELPARTA